MCCEEIYSKKTITNGLILFIVQDFFGGVFLYSPKYLIHDKILDIYKICKWLFWIYTFI